jgi:hypothetical protein
MDPTPLITIEPWEEAYTQDEVREELDEIFPSSTPLGQVRSRLRSVMAALRAKNRIAQLKWSALSLFSLLLQSCCWLGVDRIFQIWLFPACARKERGEPSGTYNSGSAFTQAWPLQSVWPWPANPTAEQELFFMAVGLSIMFCTGTFLNHACIESTRNIASNYELRVHLCSREPRWVLDRTKGSGLAISWVIEFLGLCGNFVNLTGFWYLIDEHAGLEQTTGRNFVLLLFVFPLVFTGVFFNDAGVDADEEVGAVAYFHSFHAGLRKIATTITGQVQPELALANDLQPLLEGDEAAGYSTALAAAVTADREHGEPVPRALT